jgi:hypothetical protein
MYGQAMAAQRMNAATGRFARQDMDGWGDPLDGEDEQELIAACTARGGGCCDWCHEAKGAGYVVLAECEGYNVCPLCWGRAPTYLVLRREGFGHEAAVALLCGSGSAYAED